MLRLLRPHCCAGRLRRQQSRTNKCPPHVTPCSRSRRPVTTMAFQAFGPLLVPPTTALNLGLLAMPLGQLASGPLEASGLQQMKYSKFASGGQTSPLPSVPSKIGMLLIYLPGFAASVYGVWTALAMTDAVVDRASLVALMLLAHFFKRTVEVGFLHRYSGNASLMECLTIGAYYGIVAWSIPSWMLQVPTYVYAQLPFSTVAPALGSILFAVGIIGNFYHHRLLAGLRKDGSKQYKVPTGGLFDYLTCPHFFFELLGWYGIAIASQQVGAFGIALGMTSYLAGRAVATKKWYQSKLEDFPMDRKAIFPFLF